MPETAPYCSTSVRFFRPRRNGLECEIEDTVIHHLDRLFGSTDPTWLAGSVPLGAGMPDLILATYRGVVTRFADIGALEAHVLAYLRVVGRARPDTIATRLGVSPENAARCVQSLLDAEALTTRAGSVGLTPACRDVLPRVTAIEVKVNNWQRGLSQAFRNRIFSHRSFVALPLVVATRVRRDPALLRSGVGVIAIDECGSVRILKQAATGRPSVWAYYYKLASLVGQDSVS